VIRVLRQTCVAAVVAVFLINCGKSSDNGSGSGSPTTPTASQTRAIRLEAVLEFGDVAVGGTAERTLRIQNDGNSPLTVTGLTGPAGGYTASWTEGTIAAGASQAVTVRFSPTEARTYNGTVTVNANHTSGTNTTPISGRGVSATPPPGPSPALSGTVRQDGATAVIEGALVIVKDTAFQAISDESGRYSIPGVPNGNYTLRATAGGYQLTERTVSVTGAVTADISMRRASSPSPSPSPSPTPSPSCCRVCTVGKACGDSCISKSDTCRVGPGCACNGLTLDGLWGLPIPNLTAVPAQLSDRSDDSSAPILRIR
jgi:hypothetical protein